MNIQENKLNKTPKKDDVFPNTPIREKQAVALTQAVNSDSNIFGFGYQHANFFNSHFGA
ncbi:hypothetical protein HGO23_08125 [Xenorhabdus budapestensis]|uniref:Uncharacterized protein n=1 Tax=Xenorhabdus budapestensis TaxID=290110 RepID=A0ABX7VNR7_XENBU|nr:hypothetical protein [Xenorhabdus budapestensis]QTL41257.1 hypothetical protein HGO23_08125 [Xenorhabdus budapestensis]